MKTVLNLLSVQSAVLSGVQLKQAEVVENVKVKDRVGNVLEDGNSVFIIQDR
jgi:uncharacterized Zn ribbon protein